MGRSGLGDSCGTGVGLAKVRVRQGSLDVAVFDGGTPERRARGAARHKPEGVTGGRHNRQDDDGAASLDAVFSQFAAATQTRSKAPRPLELGTTRCTPPPRNLATLGS